MVVAYYIQEGIKNHICTVCNELEKQGHKDLANIIKENIMAITQSMATSFKKELLEGKHNFLASGGNSFKLLCTQVATMGALPQHLLQLIKHLELIILLVEML